MTDKRLILALPALALLAACGGDAPASDGRSASGEVLEGTISDAMLPVDTVRSEPPLEDPEAFEKARSKAQDGDLPEGEESDAAGPEGGEPAAAEPAEQPAAEPEG